MSKYDRLPGHELASADVDVQPRVGHGKARLGKAECACGERSPQLPKNKRLEWHRAHKDEIRSRDAGTGGAQ